MAKKVTAVKHRTNTKPTSSEVGYKKPPKQHQFKPGNKMNPKGAAASLEVRALKAVTNATLATMIQKIVTLKPDEVKELLESSETNALEAIVLGTILDAIKHRNYDKLERLLERVIGKVPDKVESISKIEQVNITAESKEQLVSLIKQIEDEY